VVSTTPRQAWDNAASHGGPGRLPSQDDATGHHLTVAPNGAIAVGTARISVGKHRAGQRLTAIRDHGHVTVYTLAGRPIGHIRLDHDRKYQGTLTPAA